MMTTGWLRYRAVRHVAFWATALGLNLLMQLPGYLLLHIRPYTWGLLLVQLPADLLTIYPLLYGLLPRLLRRQPLGLLGLVGWLLGTSMLVSVLSWRLDSLINPHSPGSTWDHLPDVLWRIRVGYFVLLITAGVAVTIKVMSRWRAQVQLSRQLQQRRLQTELELLKAQLQPTFLFNTLATLHTLTTQKSPESPAAVLHLSALLRYLLYESQLPTVPLAEEAELLRHYVALEQLRLAGLVEVSLSVSGPLEAHVIAPLLLLPFVESAFRHGPAAPQDCPWISIDLVAKKDSLTCKIIHSRPETGPADPATEPDLSSIRARLTRLYPGQHELKLVAEPDTFLVVLQLRLAPASAFSPETRQQVSTTM